MNTFTRLRPVPLVQLPSLFIRTYRANPLNRKGFQGPAGHGEKIWVFCNRKTRQVIYSFYDKLDGHHSLKQLAFNGKKTKQAKLRKDYWSPMAIIEFPQGQGHVGRSVFQKLRELKHLHEVSWGAEIANKTPGQYTKEQRALVDDAKAEGKEVPVFKRDRRLRGMALNARKPYAIADMAAVLAGQGKGNFMWADQGAADLLGVSVRWQDEADKQMAQEWSTNVSHQVMEAADRIASLGVEDGVAEAQMGGASPGQAPQAVPT